MSDAGYIYVLENISIENMVKIGKTTRKPEERAKELSSTGVPTPFTVAYSCYVMDCSETERLIHKYLESKGQRVSTKREFFNISTAQAISAIQSVAKDFTTRYGSISYNDNNINKKSSDIIRSSKKVNYHKSSINLKYHSIHELFNKQDIKYEKINNQIIAIMKNHINKLIEIKLTPKTDREYMRYLTEYIEDNLETEIIEISNINDYYKTFDEILTIVYMIILSSHQPKLYKFNYFKGYLNREELTVKIKEIIHEHKVELSHDITKISWEYRRNVFFEKYIKNNLKNPKIALHILFKEICEDELEMYNNTQEKNKGTVRRFER